MIFNDLLNHIKKNGGATCTRNLKIKDFSSGFMYSLDLKENKPYKITNANEIKQEVSRLCNELKRGQYLGFWLEGQNLYIDISQRAATLKHAKSEGRKNNQLSIFNNKTKEVIYLE